MVETDKKSEILHIYFILPRYLYSETANKEDVSNLTAPSSFIKWHRPMDSFNRKRNNFQCPIIPNNNSPETILPSSCCFQSINRFNNTFCHLSRIIHSTKLLLLIKKNINVNNVRRSGYMGTERISIHSMLWTQTVTKQGRVLLFGLWKLFCCTIVTDVSISNIFKDFQRKFYIHTEVFVLIKDKSSENQINNDSLENRSMFF